MKRIVALLSAAAMLAMVTAFAVSSVTSAHETREVADGQFQFVVGFLNEPAFQDDLNAASIRITTQEGGEATPDAADDHGGGTPVEGLVGSLNIEVIYEDQRMDLEVMGVWGEPGHYVGYFIPTEPGDYTFHVTGEIDGVEIDEMFTSGPETFSVVEPRVDYEFPARN
jgi:hypothetical protein